jgi:hypothetical protein
LAQNLLGKVSTKLAHVTMFAKHIVLLARRFEMQRCHPMFALAALTLLYSAPLYAQDTDPPAAPQPPAAEEAPADVDVGPPGDIVVPKPEEVVPEAEAREGGRIGRGTGDLNIRAPYADVHVGDSDGNPRVHVRAPYADVRVDSRDGINVVTPIGPIRIGGRGGLNLRELGDRFGVRVEEDGVAIDPADALPRTSVSSQRAVLGVQLNDDDGIRISSVRSGSPADKANLVAGDRVVSMNGYVFPTADSLSQEIGRMRVGDRVQLTIERDGRLYRSNATLEARR